MKALLFAIVAPVIAVGQMPIDVSRYPNIVKHFEPGENEKHLDCNVRGFRPALGFTFRFQTGYVFNVPMNQFFGPGHKWAVLARVTPEDGHGDPLYLGDRYALPDIPKTNVELQAAGLFLVGLGRYRVDVVLQDEIGRACRSSWTTEAKLRREERSVTVAMPPDTAQALSFRTWSPGGENGNHGQRITVLLHAAPLFSRMTKLRANDRGLLLGSLVSLLDSIHPASVRLVVFNLDQQREIYRSGRFRPEDLGRVSEAMSSVDLGLVNYSVLQNRRGHLDVVADLVNQELRNPERSDVVIFLGPTARYADKIPESKLDERTSDSPPFYYFQYKPFWNRGADFPDSIGYAIKRLKGKTVVIRTPADFAKAIEGLESRVAGSSGERARANR